VDLTPFGLDNPNQVFVATDEPHGLIEATFRRE
jgi:urate oxidase